MNEPIEFPIFIVMRNGHILPPGIHVHKINAEATAAREEGIVVSLCPIKPSSSAMAAAREIIGAYLAHLPNAHSQAIIDAEEDIAAIIAKHMNQATPGYVMVPREPTEEMLSRASQKQACSYEHARQMWFALLAAAQPPKGEGNEEV